MRIRDIKWTAYVLIGICLVLVGWLYLPIFKWWFDKWWADESYYSHGILIPPISLFIVWLKREKLGETAIKAQPRGYLVVVPVLAAVVLAYWAGPNSIVGLTFPMLIGGLVLLLLGSQMARELAFPIGYLYFMCVLPGLVLVMASFRIQMLSVAGATTLLQALTLDAYHQGATIMLPKATVLVGAPCSGIRMLISLFAFAVLFAYLK